MATKRHNIDTIAEVLIDKLSDMQRTAKLIERASEKTLKVDVRELKELLEQQERKESEILREIEAIKKKNKGRVDSFTLTVVCVSFLASIVFSIYVWKKAEAYDYQKKRADHWEQKYLEMEKKEN